MNPEEEALGTTFVTMGSSGPKFYDNTPYWWDDVVFDENVQMGGVLEITDEGLKMATYTVDGRLVDSYTVKKPTGTWRMGSIGFDDGTLNGVGFQSYPGSRDNLTVTAATYDSTQQKLVDVRTADVTLRHEGAEQFVSFDSPLPVSPSDTVKVFVWDSLGNGVPLQASVLVREGIEGHGTQDDPYLLRTPADFTKIDYDPDGYYLLAGDIDFGGVVQPQIGESMRFTGSSTVAATPSRTSRPRRSLVRVSSSTTTARSATCTSMRPSTASARTSQSSPTPTTAPSRAAGSLAPSRARMPSRDSPATTTVS